MVWPTFIKKHQKRDCKKKAEPGAGHTARTQ